MENRRTFTKEQENYLESIVFGRDNKELAQIMNEKFGLNITDVQVRSFRGNRGLTATKRVRKTALDKLYISVQDLHKTLIKRGRSEHEIAKYMCRILEDLLKKYRKMLKDTEI